MLQRRLRDVQKKDCKQDMPDFHFRLDAVMKLREQVRDERLEELGNAFEAERVLLDKISNITKELKDLRGVLPGSSTRGKIDMDKLLSVRRYEFQLMSQKRELEKHIQEIETEIERRRTAVVMADREVRVLEKISEKRQAEFDANQQRHENKILDEFVSGRRDPQEDVSLWVN